MKMSFSTHHLNSAFSHKSSLTVAELRDYITRRKNQKISIVKRGKNACTRSRIRIVLVHVVIERPLRRSRDDIATRRCRFHKKQIEPKKSNEGKVRGLPGQYSREFVDQSCQIFCQFEGHHPYLRSHLTTHL